MGLQRWLREQKSKMLKRRVSLDHRRAVKLRKRGMLEQARIFLEERIDHHMVHANSGYDVQILGKELTSLALEIAVVLRSQGKHSDAQAALVNVLDSASKLTHGNTSRLFGDLSDLQVALIDLHIISGDADRAHGKIFEYTKSWGRAKLAKKILEVWEFLGTPQQLAGIFCDRVDPQMSNANARKALEDYLAEGGPERQERERYALKFKMHFGYNLDVLNDPPYKLRLSLSDTSIVYQFLREIGLYVDEQNDYHHSHIVGGTGRDYICEGYSHALYVGEIECGLLSLSLNTKGRNRDWGIEITVPETVGRSIEKTLFKTGF